MSRWKVVSVNDNYLVSDSGEIFSTIRNKILKQENTSRGYKRVTLSNNSTIQRYQVHRLVAEAFIPNPDKKSFINHIDSIRDNNSYTNLEWVSHSENMIHSYKYGLSYPGEKMYGAKLTNFEVEYICELIELGLTRGEVRMLVPSLGKAAFDTIRQRRKWKFISNNYTW